MSVEIKDYPIAETRPERIRGRRGRSLDDLTLENVLSGDTTIEDLCITPDALKMQADIARLAGRPALAANFERAAELVNVPQELIMETYELLRPGRAKTLQVLLDRAAMFRQHGAHDMARFLETAARHYRRRGLIRD